MLNPEADPFATHHRSLDSQLSLVKWSIDQNLLRLFSSKRSPVTCTTILMKLEGATRSSPLEGCDDLEDFQDMRERLVQLGLYSNVDMRIMDVGELFSGNWRRAEESLRQYAITGVPADRRAGAQSLAQKRKPAT